VPDTAVDTVRPSLTLRQQEVLDLLAAGKTDEEIAEHLGISPRTVLGHLSKISVKFGVPTRDELQQAAAARITPQPLISIWPAERQSLAQLLAKASGLLADINADLLSPRPESPECVA
jgi:DNA-binding CsgD family transcriptional regulator